MNPFGTYMENEAFNFAKKVIVTSICNEIAYCAPFRF